MNRLIQGGDWLGYLRQLPDKPSPSLARDRVSFDPTQHERSTLMGHYYYRGKKYTKRKNKAWRTIKRVANRAFDAMHGNHAGGAEALVDRMIEQFPEKPRQAEPPAPLPDPTASLEPDPKE